MDPPTSADSQADAILDLYYPMDTRRRRQPKSKAPSEAALSERRNWHEPSRSTGAVYKFWIDTTASNSPEQLEKQYEQRRKHRVEMGIITVPDSSSTEREPSSRDSACVALAQSIAEVPMTVLTINPSRAEELLKLSYPGGKERGRFKAREAKTMLKRKQSGQEAEQSSSDSEIVQKRRKTCVRSNEKVAKAVASDAYTKTTLVHL
ncbi:hypothetical protein VNI00_019421 [Paramarasmius palmivorus]|uniref:Uncharacterized protein n=1 Tax=Paramarasmius palmivorus TaxID=297713 RepID=A0AAW0ALK7_9AGAR